MILRGDNKRRIQTTETVRRYDGWEKVCCSFGCEPSLSHDARHMPTYQMCLSVLIRHDRDEPFQ